MQKLNQYKYAEAADVIAQRIKAVLSAKSAKGSWEKAQQIEVLATHGGPLATASELSLTGLGL